MVELGFRCLEDFFGIYWSRKVTNASRKVLSYDHKHYHRSHLESILVLLVNGVANGFTSTASRSDNSLLSFKDEHQHDPIMMKHYKEMMENVVIYYFAYGVPKATWSYHYKSVEKKTVETAISNFRYRASARLWSCEAIDGLEQLGSLDVNTCKGHNYYVAVIYDRLINEGAAKIINEKYREGRHVLTAEESRNMFEVNKDRCFWDRRSVAELSALLS